MPIKIDIEKYKEKLGDQYEALQKELADANKALDDAEATGKATRSQLDELVYARDTTKKALAAAEARAIDLQKRLDTAGSPSEAQAALEKELAELKSANEQAKRQADESSAALGAMRREILVGDAALEKGLSKRGYLSLFREGDGFKGIKFDKDGKPENIDEAIKGWKDAEPALFGTSGGRLDQGGTPDKSIKPDKGGDPDLDTVVASKFGLPGAVKK